ncbi:MAG: threonylcarbamoyl-AMP synthase [Chromatiaceae bacterium]|nr:threonylcarbamoyl-AMP synthase [Gammaproteobacteria bacterium]MCP5318447.1 threonylcarbamoyl-AMP synthase [Chromatiaceae bacterium]MCW5585001.1 threonylcarbamoyl-AMP synthase [Chromatiales bacterium]MCP5430967.1 threonylcarbamoyl-AMP synthase [Chromatiaceae bacterium]HOP17149.1 L-threonylcarbamoyladenylate synthase [Gammaproteobacteria bacterium]
MPALPNRFSLHRAARILRDGGIVAYPTEAVYGLGCDPLNGDAVHRLLALKQRPVEKGLILIASHVDQLTPFILPVTDTVRARLDQTWPGPATWLLPANPATPTWLRGRHTSIAVRVTAHPLAAALCEAFGAPIVSTSANASGRPPARSALQARLRCPGIDLVLSGTTGGLRRPTPIRDALSGEVLRAG